MKQVGLFETCVSLNFKSGVRDVLTGDYYRYTVFQKELLFC